MSKKRRRSKKKNYKQQFNRTPSERSIVKANLIRKYGKRCWCCGKYFPLELLTLHHIHPISITHTTTDADSMILCKYCHFEVVNRITYGTDEYWNLMGDILFSIGRRLPYI